MAGNAGGGILAIGPSATQQIGGPTAAQRNVIANNLLTEISLGGSGSGAVQSNYIGTDASGTTSLHLAGVAVYLGDTPLIGGMTATPGEPPGNVLAVDFYIPIGDGRNGPQLTTEVEGVAYAPFPDKLFVQLTNL